MALIKENTVVEDTWVHVDDSEELSLDETVIVSLDRWRDKQGALSELNAPIGIRLRSDQPPSEIADDLSRVAVIALEFPAFTDGRAYSYARLLRERFGFSGEIRAVGNVLRDQLSLMQRCGFDAFEVNSPEIASKWLEAFQEIDVVYQPTEDNLETVMSRRQRAHTGRSHLD